MRAIDADNTREIIQNVVEHLAEAGNGAMAGSLMFAAEVIDAQPTIEPVKQEWIKVEDGTPEQFSSAIVFDGDAVGEAIYDGKRFKWVFDEDIAYATHWMPLPEPPKKDAKMDKEV